MSGSLSLQTPLRAGELRALRAGEAVELSGVIYTARDAAHTRFAEEAAAGRPLPVDLTDALLFYAGPCPSRPGRVIGPIAPTTSLRMDGYLELCYRLGVAGTIGKGGRSPEAARLCREYGRVYFLSYGGMAALISEQVKKCENAAYDDLGAEAVKRLWVEKLRLIVGIDTTGAAFCNEEIRKYRRGGALFGEDMQHILGA